MSDSDDTTHRTALTEELVEGFRAGDEAAMSKLFRRLRAALRAEIRADPLFAVLQHRYSDEDILHELWLQVFPAAFERFENRGRGSLRAFLFRAIDCVMVDIARRDSADKRGGGRQVVALDASDSSTGAEPQPVARDPGPSMIAAQDDWMAACASALDGRELELWRLRAVEGLDFAEIGERLGCTASAARGVWSRARERLRNRGLLDWE